VTILELAEWHDGQAKEIDDNVAFHFKSTAYPDVDMMESWESDAARHRATDAALRELDFQRTHLDSHDCIEDIREAQKDVDRLLQEIKS